MKQTQYQCSYEECQREFSTVQGVILHQRRAHGQSPTTQEIANLREGVVKADKDLVNSHDYLRAAVRRVDAELATVGRELGRMRDLLHREDTLKIEREILQLALDSITAKVGTASTLVKTDGSADGAPVVTEIEH